MYLYMPMRQKQRPHARNVLEIRLSNTELIPYSYCVKPCPKQGLKGVQGGCRGIEMIAVVCILFGKPSDGCGRTFGRRGARKEAAQYLANDPDKCLRVQAEGLSMAKAAFRHMSEAERQRIACVARQLFQDGYPATTVCERFKIPMCTLVNICRQHCIEVPRQRHRREEE
jgi:hypothetical protein